MTVSSPESIHKAIFIDFIAYIQIEPAKANASKTSKIRESRHGGTANL